MNKFKKITKQENEIKSYKKDLAKRIKEKIDKEFEKNHIVEVDNRNIIIERFDFDLFAGDHNREIIMDHEFENVFVEKFYLKDVNKIIEIIREEIDNE